MREIGSQLSHFRAIVVEPQQSVERRHILLACSGRPVVDIGEGSKLVQLIVQVRG